jgi:hypothetical protein
MIANEIKASRQMSPSSVSPSLSNRELIKQAEILWKEERTLEAARLLRQVQESSSELLIDFHYRLLENAFICEKAVAELLSAPDQEWSKQGESSGRYPTNIYYKVESGARLTCRLETPVPSNMLVPLLSVLNESSLYDTWIPSWKNPVKIGVSQSKQLLQDTKGHQIIQIKCDVPWPFASREVLMDVIAIDDIHTNGFIMAKMRNVTEMVQDNLLPNFALPAVDPGMERIEFDGHLLFRKCPQTYPNYEKIRKKFPPDEDLILLQFAIAFDAHMSVPKSITNFVTRTVIGHIWAMFLRVAEQVRDGTRQEHTEAINKKVTFYKWMEERCQYMLQKMETTGQRSKAAATPPLPEDCEDWTMTDVMRLSL